MDEVGIVADDMTTPGWSCDAPAPAPDHTRAGATASVVVVGSINTDQVVRIERRPGPGETVGNGTIELHSGGKGANQAAAAARCGATVAMVGRVGNDPYGHAQREALSDDALDVSFVEVTDGVPTGLAIVMVTPDGENSIIVVPGANRRLSAADVDAAAPLVTTARVLVAQLEVPLEAVQRAVDLAAESAGFVVLNCAPFSALPVSVLASTTVLVANEVEAAALARCPTGSLEEAFDAASRIHTMGPRYAVITLGPLGAVVVGAHEHAHVPAKSVPVVDTTGAGDAFVGALAAALSKGRGIVDAVRFGVDVGSATTTSFGARAVVPSRLSS
ncbi:MAG: ribokinase [Actinomycetota bacterium]|jgi:ribokinase|nr:ribokinase [Actinomycetota bacterium]